MSPAQRRVNVSEWARTDRLPPMDSATARREMQWVRENRSAIRHGETAPDIWGRTIGDVDLRIEQYLIREAHKKGKGMER